MAILVAGLTPADQKTLVFDNLRLDQVNRAAEVYWSLSGKPVNVGIGIAQLGGVDSVLVTQLGGERFERFEDELRKLGVRCRLVRSGTPTRNCTTLIDSGSGTVTELVENSPPIGTAELSEFEAIFRRELASADLIILAGTLPRNCPKDIYERLLDRCGPEKRIIADLQGEVLLNVLIRKPFLVKPNREELAATLGRAFSTEKELFDGMRELNDRGAQWTLITDGPRAVWLSSATELYRFEPIAVSKEKIVNSIGCGDSMTAALAWSLCRNNDVIEAVRLGIAASAWNLMRMLPARLDTEEVAALAGRIKTERFD